MKNLFGAGATAFLTCLDMAVKSEVEKWPDEEEKTVCGQQKRSSLEKCIIRGCV